MKKNAAGMTLYGILCSALLTLTMVNQTAADGTEQLGPPSIPIADGSGVYVTGVGLHENQPGSIIVDVPSDIGISQVLLYWYGRFERDGEDPGNTDSILVNGESVSGPRIGGATPEPALYPYNTYRADITDMSDDLDWINVGEINELEIEGLDFEYHDSGAAVVIIWDDGSETDIRILDGNDWAFEPLGAQTVPIEFPLAPSVIPQTAYIWLIVTDVAPANRPSAVDVIVGDSTNRMDILNAGEGDFLDVVELEVPVPAGTTNVTVQVLSIDDGSGDTPSSLAWGFVSWELALPKPPDDPGGDDVSGCTYTIGYWKNHEEDWPTDELSLFSGAEAMDLLWAKPKKGNAYIILAHQYIAAELNVVNGASIPAEVEDAWLDAQALLEAYAGEGTIPKKSSDRAEAIELASMLDAYNNGEIGPGHCD